MSPEVVYAIRELAASIEKGCTLIANAMNGTVEAKSVPQTVEAPTPEEPAIKPKATPAAKPIDPKKLREQATPLVTKVLQAKGIDFAKSILKKYAVPNAEGQHKLTGVPDDSLNELITELRNSL